MASSRLAAFIPTFLYSQLLVRIPFPTTSFSGQTILITGSNVGLGLEAARHIIHLGAAKVVLAVRTLSKGEAAAEDIVRCTGVMKDVIEVWKLDMSDVESVKAFAKRASGLQRLDAAVLNAGVLTNDFNSAHSSLGMESTIAVNVVGTLLLAALLLPTLRRSAKTTGQRGRLAIVGSDTMYVADPAGLRPTKAGQTILDHLNDPNTRDMSSRYPLSKLLVFWSLQHLARLSPLSAESNVIITDLTPGFCRSTIMRDEGSNNAAFALISSLLARTTEVGGRTLVFGASTTLPAEAHGKMVMDNRVVSKQWENIDNPQLKSFEEKWNAELFTLLDELAPGCTKEISL